MEKLWFNLQKEKKRKETYLFSLLTVWTVAMIYLFLEGVQARLMGSSAFLIYSTKWKTSYEDLFIAMGRQGSFFGWVFSKQLDLTVGKTSENKTM